MVAAGVSARRYRCPRENPETLSARTVAPAARLADFLRSNLFRISVTVSMQSCTALNAERGLDTGKRINNFLKPVRPARVHPPP